MITPGSSAGTAMPRPDQPCDQLPQRADHDHGDQRRPAESSLAVLTGGKR